MQLPPNAEKLMADAAFGDISAERKTQIVAHLAQTPDSRARATIDVLIQNGGPEARFVAKLFGREAPQPGGAPQNMQAQAPDKL
jgi:hypothetical protein